MLTLAYFTEDDFGQLIDWIPDARFTMQWSGPNFTYPITNEQLETYIDDANHPLSNKYVFKVMDEETNQCVGHVSIGQVDRINKTARIGKVLIGDLNSRGKGYGTKLMQAALHYAFDTLQLHSVTLGVFDFNISAIHCYEKIGFKQVSFVNGARKFGTEDWNLIEMDFSADSYQPK